MEYSVRAIASIVLLPRYFLNNIFYPINTIRDAIIEEKSWSFRNPEAGIIAAVSILLLTMAVYSHLKAGDFDESVYLVTAVFDKNTPYAFSSFWGIIAYFIISILICFIWLAIAQTGYHRAVCETGARMSMISTFNISVHYLLNAILNAHKKGITDPVLADGFLLLIGFAAKLFLMIALAYLVVSAVMYRRQTRASDVD